MEAKPYRHGDHEGWNIFNAIADNGHFMFDRAFMEYHKDRFDDSSLIVTRQDEIVGLLPANRSEATVYSHQGLSFGGLVVANANTIDVLEMLDACLDTLRGVGCRHLVYKPMPWIYQQRPTEGDLYWLHCNEARLRARDISTAIDFRRPGSFSSRRKRGYRKAERVGLEYCHSDRWGGFWSVLTEVLQRRHGVQPTHSVEEIQMLSTQFPNHIKLYAAEEHGALIAGVVIFETSTVAHAQYISANERGREVGALDGLFRHLLCQYQDNRSYFDFGVSNNRRDNSLIGDYDLNVGLITQKEEFGGSAVVQDVYELNL